MSEEKFPKGWKVVKFKDVTTIIGGGTPSTSIEEYYNGDIPWLSPVDLSGYKEKYISRGRKNITQLGLQKSSARLLPKNSVLFSSRAPIGYVAIAENEITTNQGFKNLLPSPLYDPSFAYFYLKYKRDYIESQASGTTFKEISGKKLGEIEFILPPLPEQQRIVAKLDEIFGHLDRVREKLDRIPELLKNFRQQVLTQAVTGELTREWREGKNLGEWKETTFGEVMEGTPKNGAYFPKDLYGSGIRIIRIDAFYDGFLKDWSKLQRVNITKSDLEQYNIQVGDILVNRVNSMEYLGKCMLVDKLPEPCIYESNMMRVRLQIEKITSEFTRVFLTSPIGLKELRKNAKQAVNQASINQKDVMQVQISIPSLKEQQEIVKRVDALFGLADKIESQYQSLKAKIDQMPQAILAKAFRGELVEQEVKEYEREIGELGMVAEGAEDYGKE